MAHLLLLILLNLPAYNEPDIKSMLIDKLHMQAECWNSGDIDCFMKDYWKHDSLMYIGKNGITYGWENTLENYKKRYPTPATMGQLTFEIIKVEKINDKSFFMVGKWKLSRDMGDLSGHFSLLWKKIRGDWVIVADHSS